MSAQNNVALLARARHRLHPNPTIPSMIYKTSMSVASILDMRQDPKPSTVKRSTFQHKIKAQQFRPCSQGISPPSRKSIRPPSGASSWYLKGFLTASQRLQVRARRICTKYRHSLHHGVLVSASRTRAVASRETAGSYQS